ncbi:Peroxisomal carnitine O-octanoyltransferase, partial [Eschrichtius robustus]|nr:Peroxisomal carnitine O-octanoyltransferase [Eschrichtius robustus]
MRSCLCVGGRSLRPRRPLPLLSLEPSFELAALRQSAGTRYPGTGSHQPSSNLCDSKIDLLQHALGSRKQLILVYRILSTDEEIQFSYCDRIMENQLAKSTEERTFQYQDSLPSLPVPSLEESLKKYLESEFWVGNGFFLEDWWLNVAYLDVRIPSQLHVNFGGPASHIEHYWPPKEGTQLERGSISLWHILNYWQLLRKEKLPVHKVGNTPLDMNQFRMLFATCKVPGITRDSLINYFRT